MKPLTDEHLAILRRHMVEIIEMHFDLASDETDGRVLGAGLRQALMAVPRHLFVPSPMILACYQDSPVPIGFDKTLSQPFIGALMLDLLDVRPGMRVLEVGTGLGYQAAVMAEIGATVFSVEVVEEFAELAESRFLALGHDVKVRVGDGSRGWAEHAPFDAILVTAAAARPPQDLIDQLQTGGSMVLPLGGEEVQQLTLMNKIADGVIETHPGLLVRFTQLELAG